MTLTEEINRDSLLNQADGLMITILARAAKLSKKAQREVLVFKKNLLDSLSEPELKWTYMPLTNSDPLNREIEKVLIDPKGQQVEDKDYLYSQTVFHELWIRMPKEGIGGAPHIIGMNSHPNRP